MASIRRPLYIPYAGPSLLEMPLLNKGSAFTFQERLDFNLIGLLPQAVESIDEQADRAYRQYCQCTTDIDRHIYLRAIQDDNETLFFRLLETHLEEMLPIIYTPTVGRACEEFSNIYRNHRGLFVAYPDLANVERTLRSATKEKVKVIVVTDGERILGLGDQGIGGMGIPIGKLSLYTACGGISPAHTLPVVLDAGTNNQSLLNDPMYMGWRHERIDGGDYDAFIDRFIGAAKARWPGVLVQFEDFARRHATPLLERYRDDLCCFNDDIQGTAAVVVATLLAASKAQAIGVTDQRVVLVGAGSAGCGIAEQIIRTMVEGGLSERDARARIFMVDRSGLLTDKTASLPTYQARLAQDSADSAGWNGRDLLEVVKNVRPTALIGVSGQAGLFSEDLVRELHSGCPRPLILPLSNPMSRSEATPEALLNWTDGQAIVATGTPFPPVSLAGRLYPVSQCNNAYIFPGIGLGVLACGATRITGRMLMAASKALAGEAPVARQDGGALLPPLSDITETSKSIAFQVARQAQNEGMAPKTDDEFLWRYIENSFWRPRYREYRRRAF